MMDYFFLGIGIGLGFCYGCATVIIFGQIIIDPILNRRIIRNIKRKAQEIQK